MNSFDIIGYTYEAAVHCDPCAAARFGRCPCEHYDVHGIDGDGVEIEPIFADSENVEELSCDDCGGRLL